MVPVDIIYTGIYLLSPFLSSATSFATEAFALMALNFREKYVQIQYFQVLLIMKVSTSVSGMQRPTMRVYPGQQESR